MRKMILGALAATLLTGCDSVRYIVEENVTGLEVQVTFAAQLELDQLHISGETVHGNPAFEPALIPDPAQAIEGTEHTFTLLLPESSGNVPLRITIIGYSVGEPVAAGFGETVIVAQELTALPIALLAETLCLSDTDTSNPIVGTDLDNDGVCDAYDDCVDLDQDGFGGVGYSTAGCAYPGTDRDDSNPSVCADTDTDSCDDCSRGSYDPAKDGADGDRDGICDAGDGCTDNDGDGFGTGTLENQSCDHFENDADDHNPMVCADTDDDGCDDCTGGEWDPAEDGSDQDFDGRCDSGDTCTDADGDGVGIEGLRSSDCLTQAVDSDDSNPTVCVDLDGDGCNDCSTGTFAPENDGDDFDDDGICNSTDTCTDLDGDGLGHPDLDRTGCSFPHVDQDDGDAYRCTDSDSDGCDDCSSGSFDTHSDGPDGDLDSICDSGDSCTDFDGDGFGVGTLGNAGCLLSQNDIDDSMATRCTDSDGDTCDDCSQGAFNPLQDGADGDADGTCDLVDTCTDFDGDGLGNGNLGNVGCIATVTDSNDAAQNVCADTDSDSCNDCVSGTYAPHLDGADLDVDGICDLTDSCVDWDNDGFGTGNLANAGCAEPFTDMLDSDPTVCIDSDQDGCNDCVTGTFSPTNDGPDADSDGRCDAHDTCVDADQDGLGVGINDNVGCSWPLVDEDDADPYHCVDSDFDGCDDCFHASIDPWNDGPDQDEDGLCDTGDTCTDLDGDGLGLGTLDISGCEVWVADLNDENPYACNDTDGDTCDDCSSGSFNIYTDGPDGDHDSICDAGDTCSDADGDGLGNGHANNSGCVSPITDSADSNAQMCADSDNDGCDDCALGPFNPNEDGPDYNNDGLCNVIDPCEDNDGDGLCGNADCDDSNPHCGENCTDLDDDGYCAPFDCNEYVATCNTDCTTNSDGSLENFPMVDCLEVLCNSDPFNPLSSCMVVTSGEDLAGAIVRADEGETTLVVGNVTVESELPRIDGDGTIHVVQKPGTSITLYADRLFEVDSDGNSFTDIHVLVHGAEQVFDIDADHTRISGVRIDSETGLEPDRGMSIRGDDNLVEDSFVDGYNDRGISITGSSSSDNVIRDTVIRGGTEVWSESRGGIYVQDARDTLMVGNVVVQNTGIGVVFKRARAPTLVHNTVAENLVGIAFMGNSNRPSEDVCARNNSITHNSWAGVAAPSGVSWETRDNCEFINSQNDTISFGHGNNIYGTQLACSTVSCNNCSCLPSHFFEFEQDPHYQSTQSTEENFYCLGHSVLVDGSMATMHDRNGDQSGLYNGTAPDVGAREAGSILCE